MTSVETTVPDTGQSCRETPPEVKFSLAAGEPTVAGLRRILVEQVGLGSWHLERTPLSDSHVHEVRKSTKRVRAVLRMLSDDIDSRDYTRLNMEVRDLARELSQIRSAVVQVGLLESLVANDCELSTATREFNAELVASADDQRRGLEDAMVQGLLLRFAAVRSHIGDIEFPDEGETSLDGIRKTYRRGRRSMTHAYEAPTVESFHIWRKQVKYLRHQMEVLEWGGALAVAALVSDLEEIGEALGMDHDLADLEQAADRAAPSMLSRSSRRHLHEVISARRASVELRLRPIAAKVYEVKPGTFAQRVIQRSV